MVTSEAVPFSKSGGLADVVGALPPALIAKGHDVRVVVPAYNMKPEDCGRKVCSLSVSMLNTEYTVDVHLKSVRKTKYYLLCNPMYCDRKGIYGDTSFEPYSDNLQRFTVLCKSSLGLCEKTGFKPDIIHCHDWGAGLLPYFLKTSNNQFFKGCKSVFTIHNLAYQGPFPRLSFLLSGEKPNENLFKDNNLNMLKSALVYSDFITTVSPTYAVEIQSSLQGCGLENILLERNKRLKGIINGIDINEWNPQKDKDIPVHFSASSIKNKAKLKALVQQQFNLPQAPDVPLFAMISRLASQKGFDTLLQCLEGLLANYRLQFVIIGTGDKNLENSLKELAEKYDNLSVNIMFSNKAAHLVEAGSDFFVMPSKYEPCGLNQLYSLRYGTLPVARRTGGLADTIVDQDEYPLEGTGLLFDNPDPDELAKKIIRATELYSKPVFNAMRLRAMSKDFSWSASADEYIKVYEKLIH